MNDINAAIGARIREQRKALGLTQAEVGQRVGLVKAQVSKYEAGSTKFTAEVLLLFSNLFNASLDYLLTGATSPVEPAHSDPRINDMAGEYKGYLSILKPLDRRAEQLVGAYQYLCDHDPDLAQKIYDNAIESLLISKLK